jgi:hypothetical protein
MAYLLHATSTRSRAISGKAATHSWRADLLSEKSSTSSSAVASVVLGKRISGQNRTSGAELARFSVLGLWIFSEKGENASAGVRSTAKDIVMYCENGEGGLTSSHYRRAWQPPRNSNLRPGE